MAFSSDATFISGGHNFYLFSDMAGSSAHKAWAQEIIVCRMWLLDPLQALSMGLYPLPEFQDVEQYLE